jgi:imidazole glycerol-phosphate synthase subunit HisH
MGNLASVKNMIHKVHGVAEISNDPSTIHQAKKIILPGVGAFD